MANLLAIPMYIKKLTKSNNAFSYGSFEWDAVNPLQLLDKDGNLVDSKSEFEKCNILFGENGNGKSKLVKIFHTLNDPSRQLEKHRDLHSKPQEVEILFDDDTSAKNSGSGWSDNKAVNKFVVFDKHYVDTFVHSPGTHDGDTSQRKQQRGKSIVYLGDFGKYNDEIDKINTLKEKIKEKSDAVLKAQRQIVTGIIASQSYELGLIDNSRTAIESVDEAGLVGLKETELKIGAEITKVQTALSQSQKVIGLETLTPRPYIAFSLTEDVGGISSVVDASDLFSFSVSAGIQKTIEKIATKTEFIHQGVRLLVETANECPFCEQPIDDPVHKQVIADYQSIFTDAFEHEQKRIRDLLASYKLQLLSLKNLHITSTEIAKINTASPFFTELPALPSLSLSEEDLELLNAEILLVEKKLGQLFEKIVSPDGERVAAVAEVTGRCITEYNRIAGEINTKIEELKKNASSGKLPDQLALLKKQDLELKQNIFFIENKKHLLRYFAAIDDDAKNQKVMTGLEEIYQKMKVAIVDKFTAFVTDYFAHIKDILKYISPGMGIFDISGPATYTRVGREPAQCGFRITYNGYECSEGLSDGERQAIALAYFFAQLEKLTDKDKIVVFDDPITNFDAGKRKSTAELIYKKSREFSQTFVLTCDPLFREFCLKAGTVKAYSIYHTAGSSAVYFVPSKVARLHDAFEASLQEMSTLIGSPENVVVLGQKLRFCLETKIKEQYFGYSQDSLRNMLETVAAQGGQKFVNLLNNKDEIVEIYNYCNTGGLAHYPKDGSTSWAELQAMVARYFALSL